MIGVIQFRTDKSNEHEQLCYNKYLPNEVLDFVSAVDGAIDFSDPAEFLKPYKKLILAGSGEFLISRNSKPTAKLLKNIEPLIDFVLKTDFPTLGVCFGNQLIGAINGGQVGRDEEQAEAGIQQIKFTDAGRGDLIFANLHNPLSVSMGHEDSVLKLPKAAVQLAYSDRCQNQAFKIGQNVYGVQFHPELDDNDLYERLSLYAQYDEFQLGYDVPEIVHGPQVLYNFSVL